MLSRENKNKNNIIRAMFLYWIAVIVWQTIRPVANRSLVDSIVKVALFIPLLSYGWKNRNLERFDQSGWLFLVFLITQMLTFIFDSGDFGIGPLITMVFMMMQVIIFLLYLREEEAGASMIEYLCKALIIVAVILSLYNVIFEWNTFRRLFQSGRGAYGNECSSLLYSNHEFGLYVAVAFLAMMWLYFNKKIKGISTILIGILLLLNLLSTYSRTAILGVVIAFFILFFFYNKKKFIIACVVFGIFMVLVFSVPMLYEIVFGKIMKGSFVDGNGAFDEGRSDMYIQEWNAFKSGSFFQILFGKGYAGASEHSGHDAYLVILLTGGVVMFAFFLFIVCFAIYHSFRILKEDKMTGALMLGFQVFALSYMAAQTPILFYSSMDSFFITMIAVLTPIYVSNGIKKKER